MTPTSSAASTTARVASKSIRPPKLLQPRPTRETRRPLSPRSTSSTLSRLEVAEVQPLREHAFELEEPALEIEATAVPAETVGGDDTMARDDERQRVGGHHDADLPRVVDSRTS